MPPTSLVSDDYAADVSNSMNGLVGLLTSSRARGLAHWVVILSCGTYHPPHNDGSGLSTQLSVREGYKLIVYGVRVNGSVLPTPVPNGEHWQWNLFDGCEVSAIVLHPGVTLYVFLSHSCSGSVHFASIDTPLLIV